MLSVLLFSLYFSTITCQDYSPFKLLGVNGPLNGTEFANDNFSPSDKVVTCEMSMTFIDLDAQISFFEEGPQLTLEACASAFLPASQAVQKWTYVPVSGSPGGNIVLANPPSYFWNQTCLNVPVDSSGQVNATVNTFECLPNKNQLWQFVGGQFVNLNSSNPQLCLTVGLPGDANPGFPGSVLTLAVCDDTFPPIQNFTFDTSAAAGNIVSQASSKKACVDAGHLGQVISYNPASQNWAVSQTRAETCEENGSNDANPPFLPRTSVRDYTVGVKMMENSGFSLDRLIILDGDNADNNVWTSDDCGLNWNCYPGTNPWSTSGLALATVIQSPRNQGWNYVGWNDPVLSFGGVNYNPTDSDPYVKTAMYASGNGFQYTSLPFNLPNSPLLDPSSPDQALWPGMVASDNNALYLFGDDTWPGWPNAVYKLDQNGFNSQNGWVPLSSGETCLPDVPKARYIFLAGTNSGGCWFSGDYHAGATWGNPDPETWSTNMWYTSVDLMSWSMGPLSAPWNPRAAGGWTQTPDLTKTYLVGGMEFNGGEPNGNTFSDAWSMDASVCLYGGNSAVCSGNGNADLSSVTCDCNSPFLGKLCDLCPSGQAGPECAPCAPCVNGFCNGNGTINGDASCVCEPGWTGPACDQPSGGTSPTTTPTPTITPTATIGSSPSRTQTRTGTKKASSTPSASASATASPKPGPTDKGGLSPAAGAAIGIVSALLIVGGGLYVYAAYFGGSAVLLGLVKGFSARFGGGGRGASEVKSLLKVGAKVGNTLSSQVAAGRFAASSTDTVVPNPISSGSFQGSGKGYTSF